MTRSPFFSVVIPTNNRSDLLRQALESVFKQDLQEFEVIVVDDGSTEDLSGLQETYRGRATFLRQDNAGPAAARNRGVAVARGEYLAFLDSDDLFFPWTLDEYRKVIESSRRPSFISGSPFQFDQSTNLAQVTHSPSRIEAFRDYFASWRKWRWFGVSSFVVRRDAFQSVGGFSPEWINGEDADLAMRLGVETGFVSIERPATFAYRSHENQETANFLRTARGVMRLVDSEREAQYPGGHERRFERRRIITRHVRPVTLESLRIGSPGLAINLFENTLWWNLCERRFRYLAGFAFSALVRLARSQVGASLTSTVRPKSA